MLDYLVFWLNFLQIISTVHYTKLNCWNIAPNIVEKTHQNSTKITWEFKKKKEENKNICKGKLFCCAPLCNLYKQHLPPDSLQCRRTNKSCLCCTVCHIIAFSLTHTIPASYLILAACSLASICICVRVSVSVCVCLVFQAIVWARMVCLCESCSRVIVASVCKRTSFGFITVAAGSLLPLNWCYCCCRCCGIATTHTRLSFTSFCQFGSLILALSFYLCFVLSLFLSFYLWLSLSLNVQTKIRTVRESSGKRNAFETSTFCCMPFSHTGANWSCYCT